MSIVSCGEGKTVRTQRAVIDSLENVSWQKQCEYEELQRQLATIADGLDSIAVEEGKIFMYGNDIEMRTVNRQRAKQNLAYVRDLLSRHRERISELEKQLEVGNANSRMLKTIIVSLREQLDVKDKELAQLRRDLESNKQDIAALTQQVQQMDKEQQAQTETINQQQEIISQQQDQLNNAYIKIGSKQELKRLGLLKGGFLKKSKLDYSQIDLSIFTKVDIRTTQTLSLPPKAKILTAVPQDSYSLVKDSTECTLNILDINKFWSVSKFLIIQAE